MPVSLTQTLGELKSEVLDLLRDPGGVRYPVTRISSALGKALLKLAEDGAFWRVDVFVPTVNQGVYSLSGLPVQIQEVSWNGTGVKQADETTLLRFVGQEWRSETGDPLYFFQETRQRLRLVPAPDVIGTALTYGSVTARNENHWRGTEAHRLYGTVRASNGAYVIWEPGDGQVTNDDSATNLVRVRYSYLPAGVNDDSPVDPEIAEALVSYALWKERSVSRREEDRVLAAEHKADWIREKTKLGNVIGPEFVSVGSIDLLGACG